MSRLSFFVLLAFSLFLFSSCKQTYIIPTLSMEPTLSVGDIVVGVDRKVDYDELVIFKFRHGGVDKDEIWIKRLVAMPGDSISMNEGIVYINGKKEKSKNEYYYNYRLRSSPEVIEQLQSLGLIWHQENDNIVGAMSDSMANELGKGIYTRVFESCQVMGNGTSAILQGNADCFKSLYLPQEGDQISKPSLSRYKELIQEHEDVNINDIESYTFKRSYCFVMGDNRNHSADSRYIGLIPMDQIISVVEKKKGLFN
ncbi:signal peptidase I [bacterium]|nr:signal peptidase I [bacterium]